MDRPVRAALCCAIMLATTASALAITRINGNQMVEGAAEFGFADRALPGAETPPRLIFSVGQGIMARGELPDSLAGGQSAIAVGFGLGYDIVKYVACPVKKTGDVNVDGVINVTDLILLIQFLYNNGAPPRPCAASGDANCSGNVTTADCMLLVNYVFKGGQPPCNVCTIIPTAWPCR